MPYLRIDSAHAGHRPRRPMHRGRVQTTGSFRNARTEAPPAIGALRSARITRRVRIGSAAAHGARLRPVQLVLVPKRDQPVHDGEPARDCRAGRRRGGWPSARRPGRRHRLQRRDPSRRLPGWAFRRHLARHRSLRRNAVRGREGVRRDQRLLHPARARRAVSEPQGASRHEHRHVLRPRAARRVRRRHRAITGRRQASG